MAGLPGPARRIPARLAGVRRATLGRGRSAGFACGGGSECRTPRGPGVLPTPRASFCFRGGRTGFAGTSCRTESRSGFARCMTKRWPRVETAMSERGATSPRAPNDARMWGLQFASRRR